MEVFITDFRLYTGDIPTILLLLLIYISAVQPCWCIEYSTIFKTVLSVGDKILSDGISVLWFSVKYVKHICQETN